MEKTTTVAPMLFPYEPKAFWEQLQQIIRDEVSRLDRAGTPASVSMEIPGLTYKPLFKMAEVCVIFGVSKPTIYDWIRGGKLKPLNIRSRVYFLWQDIQQLLQPAEG